jgi:hypothetical protein
MIRGGHGREQIGPTGIQQGRDGVRPGKAEKKGLWCEGEGGWEQLGVGREWERVVACEYVEEAGAVRISAPAERSQVARITSMDSSRLAAGCGLRVIRFM